MTISEAKDILVKRLGWREDNTVEGFVLSANNLLTNSGRFYQSEHSSITLVNIRDCQPLLSISEVNFNSYLEDLKERVAYQVLSDVFEKDTINDHLFILYPSGFDNALSLRMVIVISELIMSSTRSNSIERFSKEFVGKLHYDIFRDAPNKFAIRGANYKYAMGASTRYGFEIQSVQNRFGALRNRLKTVTKGEVFNRYINDIDEQL